MEHFLQRAASELSVEAKVLLPETSEQLRQFDWPGNVRQLENTARWLTVMGSGREIHPDDLPPELHERQASKSGAAGDWREALRSWVRHSLADGREGLLEEATPEFETIMIETALEFTGGRKQDAARLLGWGRNTLTRKIKELGLEDDHKVAS
jgi:two-component system nitrogen regulation response regulator GlnG